MYPSQPRGCSLPFLGSKARSLYRYPRIQSFLFSRASSSRARHYRKTRLAFRHRGKCVRERDGAARRSSLWLLMCRGLPRGAPYIGGGERERPPRVPTPRGRRPQGEPPRAANPRGGGRMGGGPAARNPSRPLTLLPTWGAQVGLGPCGQAPWSLP